MQAAFSIGFWRLNTLGNSVQNPVRTRSADRQPRQGAAGALKPSSASPSMAGTAHTFKFSTLLWLLAGAFIPFWPITLPLCWFLAYRSYRGGVPAAGSLGDLHAAVELHKAGMLSDEEFQAAKTKALGAVRR